MTTLREAAQAFFDAYDSGHHGLIADTLEALRAALAEDTVCVPGRFSVEKINRILGDPMTKVSIDHSTGKITVTKFGDDAIKAEAER